MKEILRTRKTRNTAILTAAGTALAVNPGRTSYRINNLSGTNPLFVKEGSDASVTDFTYILPPGSADDDGKGGSYESPAGQVYTGIITVAGTSPRFNAVENTAEDMTN